MFSCCYVGKIPKNWPSLPCAWHERRENSTLILTLQQYFVNCVLDFAHYNIEKAAKPLVNHEFIAIRFQKCVQVHKLLHLNYHEQIFTTHTAYGGGK